ncbi:MAG: hypothetical protein Q9170_000693 [Blastenia crenularia]
MKVLLLGATGNLGSRLIPALLAHNHNVVIYVRSESKLKSLVDSAALSKCAIITGDATDTNTIEEALITHRCDALINSAGMAAPTSWQAPRMQVIVQAVATAAVSASEKLGYPIRCWFLGGMTNSLPPPEYEPIGLLTRENLHSLPAYPEHALTYECLSQQPAGNLEWSLLAPSAMTPANKEIRLLEAPRGNPLVARNHTMPDWTRTFLSAVPYLGMAADIMVNMMRYNTTLEDCADFMAADLAKGAREHVGHRVGIVVSDEKKGQ